MIDKRKKLLDSALKLFVEFGFHGTPTSKIAKEAGVANGTLFHYFATKEELIIALYVEIKEEMGCYISDNTDTSGSLKETIRKQYLASLYWALDNKTQFHYIQQFNSSPFTLTIGADAIEKHTKPFLAMLNNGIEQKLLKQVPADMLLSMIINHMYGFNLYLENNKFTKVQEHQLINDSFTLLWDMIS